MVKEEGRSRRLRIPSQPVSGHTFRAPGRCFGRGLGKGFGEGGKGLGLGVGGSGWRGLGSCLLVRLRWSLFADSDSPWGEKKTRAPASPPSTLLYVLPSDPFAVTRALRCPASKPLLSPSRASLKWLALDRGSNGSEAAAQKAARRQPKDEGWRRPRPHHAPGTACADSPSQRTSRTISRARTNRPHRSTRECWHGTRRLPVRRNRYERKERPAVCFV